MNDPIKQHFVPIAYLKNFAFGKKGKSIFVLYTKENKVFCDAVENVAYNKHFYTLNNYKDIYFFEKKYANHIEPQLGQLISKIRQKCEKVSIQNGATVLEPSEKTKLAFHMTVQLLRGVQTRKHIEKTIVKLLPEVIERARMQSAKLNGSIEHEIHEFESDEAFFKQSAVEMALSLKLINIVFGAMMNRDFALVKVCSNSTFVTSDNPVVFMDAKTSDVTPFANGLSDVNTLVYSPISPKLLVITYDKESSHDIFQCQDCKIAIINNEEAARITELHNRKQKEQCYNYVLSASENALEKLQIKQ